MTEMTRFTLEVPDKLLKDFEQRIKGLYGNRSEAIRAAMRLLIAQINQEGAQQ